MKCIFQKLPCSLVLSCVAQLLGPSNVRHMRTSNCHKLFYYTIE